MLTAHRGTDELFATFLGTTPDLNSEGYKFDPVILDAVFHAVMFFVMEHEGIVRDYEERDYWLPSRAGRVVMHEGVVERGVPGRIGAHLVMRGWRPGMCCFAYLFYLFGC